MPFRAQSVNALDKIKNISNDTQIVSCIVDEPTGILKQKVCYLTGSTADGIPTVGLASISNPVHLPVVGVSQDDANQGELVKIVMSGFMSVDTDNGTIAPATTDVIYMGDNGDLVGQPSGGINGNVQIGRVVKLGEEGLFMVELVSFTLTSDFSGVLRSIIENENSGEFASSSFTAKNDLGNYSSFGQTSSNSTVFPPNGTFVFNNGFGLMRFAVDGDKGFEWFTDTTDSHSFSLTKKMEMFADGELQLTEKGVLGGKETTTPTANTDFWKIYSKTDDLFYFQDGSGVEHRITDEEDIDLILTDVFGEVLPDSNGDLLTLTRT